MKGKVFLTGAGAGSFLYLTQYARFLLERADVVVYDRLIDHRVLQYTRDGAELIPVGKAPGKAPYTQETICELLAERAKKGAIVLRLKGGDPFVFGRGGEEAMYLAAHGVPFEVVPGVPSVHVAAACAGIPLTFRGKSRSFHVFSGHPEEALESLPWDAIAHLPGTLVFLMGEATLNTIIGNLLASGKDPTTPACLVMQAGSPFQRVVSGSLLDIAQKKAASGLCNPLVLFVGEVVNFQDVLFKGEHAPFPRRVMVVGSTEVLRQYQMLSDLVVFLETQGIVLIPAALLRAIPNHEVLNDLRERLKQFDALLFPSQNAASVVFEALPDLRILHDLKIWAIGAKTARWLRERGIAADYVASGSAISFLEETRDFPPHRVAIVTSKKEDCRLQRELSKRGWLCEVFPAYSMVFRTHLFPYIQEELHQGLDLIVFLSPSAYEAFFAATSKTPPCPVWAIGHTTASYLLGKNVKVSRVVPSPSLEEICMEVLRWRENQELS